MSDNQHKVCSSCGSPVDEKGKATPLGVAAYYMRLAGDHIMMGFVMGLQGAAEGVSDTRACELFGEKMDKGTKVKTLLKRLERTRETWFDSQRTKTP